MDDCWDSNPKLRPTFASLATLWRDLIYDFVRGPTSAIFDYGQRQRKRILAVANSKKKKNAWSGWTNVPQLPDKYKTLCAVRATEALIEKIKKFKVTTTTIKSPDDAGANIEDVALFLAKPARNAKNRAWKPMKDSTIASKFKAAFLDNVSNHGGDVLSKSHNAHTSRHAARG